jgi:hypothetical protein
MRTRLITILCYLIAPFSYCQDYSYSFNGIISPEKESTLISSIGSLEGVDYCKLRYKPDSHRGEIILILDKKEVRSEDDTVFSPASVKAILLENQLEPLDFRTIK